MAETGDGDLITQQIQIYHDTCSLVDINRMDVECIVAPSMVGLRALDISGRFKTFDTLRDKLAHPRNVYYDLMVTPNEAAERCPGITAADMLTGVDTFRLLQPVRGGTSWKCNCKEYFRDGICIDSVLFTMIWNPDCKVPDKYNSAKIPTRPSSRRPGVFSPVRDEPTFQDKDTPLQVWKPS